VKTQVIVKLRPMVLTPAARINPPAARFPIRVVRKGRTDESHSRAIIPANSTPLASADVQAVDWENR